MTLSDILAFLSLLAWVTALGSVFWKTWKMSKGRWNLSNHGFEKMAEVVKYALRYQLGGGVMVIADRKSQHFILFRKYIRRKGDYGIEFGLPVTEWSEAYSERLRAALSEDGIPFRGERENYGGVAAFLHVDCGKDIEKAVDLARRCFFDIFGLAEGTRFKSSPMNWSMLSAFRDEVDDPAYENPRFGDWWSTWRAREREKGVPDPALLLKVAAFTVLWLVSYPALWATWFAARGSIPAWEWDIGPVHLAGSHGSLIWLLIFVLSLVGASRTHRKLSRIQRPRPRSPLERITAPLINRGMPIAVIASWLGL